MAIGTQPRCGMLGLLPVEYDNIFGHWPGTRVPGDKASIEYLHEQSIPAGRVKFLGENLAGTRYPASPKGVNLYALRTLLKICHIYCDPTPNPNCDPTTNPNCDSTPNALAWGEAYNMLNVSTAAPFLFLAVGRARDTIPDGFAA